ncbi:MAG: hypothetical protein ACTMUB_09120 [cyanobacterium endosymbiont of Rhopalodia musculus]|uniref:hypothetical protein n=1 Tax=cyanobacterium endosymbiont of Epithemia clementina EcSB TaxID=3034674 RepID=UPI00248071FF|nr:hypothetical protein [cyanobacterium endosymbiont of Epithemia clementina EcSB]WGT68212.1 hypothetical protein P3F56_03895 [cyanobacterium endosymbiont of Epithemia clementina EcSB]
MNAFFPRFLKRAYRKDPISSFILVVGAVDVVIGGVWEKSTLLSSGLVVVLLTVILRYWQTQKAQPLATEEPPRRYLPLSSMRSPLPRLTNDKPR